MKITTLEQFRDELLSTGHYETSDGNRPAKRVKPNPFVTIAYTLRLCRVFPLCALYEHLHCLDTDKWAHFCFSSITGLERLGVKVTVEGWKTRQEYDGPVVYLCNHMSTIETILLPPLLLSYGPFNVVAKQSLSKLPFLEKAAAHMGMVPVGRKSPREDLMNMLRIGVERIKAGNSFLIFPQGTRQNVFSRNHFSSIGAKLAEKAGCPIVPIVVDTRCQLTREKGVFRKVFKDFGPVDTSRDLRCCCGPVIAHDKAKVMHERTFDWMAGKLEEWGLPVERREV